MFHPEILNPQQLAQLEKLQWLAAENYYLAGDTALALQLGHRTSVDFDFYTPGEFDSLTLLSGLQAHLGALTVQSQDERTLRVFAGDTELSFFTYPYSHIHPPVTHAGLRLASKPDIAAMKLIAVVQRGTQRDFVDIYFLLREYSLKDLLTFVITKFPGYQEQVILRALVYFHDAESAAPRAGVRVLATDYTWDGVKQTLIAEVKKYQAEITGA